MFFIFKLYVIINCNFRETFSISFFTILLNTTCSFRLFFSRYVLHLFFLRFYYTHHVLFDHYFRKTFSISFLRFYYHIMFFSIIIFAIRSASRFLRFYETQYVLFDYFFRETFSISFFTILLNTLCSFRTNTSTF